MYESVEKTFWNSLSRKLSSFLLLCVFNLAYLGVQVWQTSAIKLALAGGAPAPELVAGIIAALQDGQRVMKKDEIRVRVLLDRGAARTTVWTCDLSHDYVSINADYRS